MASFADGLPVLASLRGFGSCFAPRFVSGRAQAQKNSSEAERLNCVLAWG
ncbi:hypothetical protein BN1221_04911c [Brenneria goodwinii]|uniref:Uncharacterized protein n=1 Tax=Brenneria goodwinii TaxID=1109412 RepID=A0A0G4K2P5_9GAMM|nr:hypothetical protein BN1221_04911c [Brenneria goodwinii]